jgi:non-specific serine/threonine protein kinase
MVVRHAVGQHNLPEEVSSLIGRERQQADVAERVREHRVVTLTGVGGVGKTRLALSVARELAKEFPEGVWLAELGEITDPTVVLETIAARLGVALQRDFEPIDGLLSALGSRKVLLILDNCEHLLPVCAPLVERLVRSCARVHVLAVSRESLHVAGENVWPVSPLPTPQEVDVRLEILAQIPSVRLLLERARASSPDFDLTLSNANAIREICRKLDGLPLALELAAPRLRVLTPAELASRLEDGLQPLALHLPGAPARHQTLEATIAWSYDMLSPADQALFDRLSVFGGSFSLAAVLSVCVSDTSDALEGITRLVDHSMLSIAAGPVGERRFAVLQTLRAVGRDKLRRRGEDALIRNRLSAWVRDAARRAGVGLRGTEQAYWLRWAEQEHANIRAALSWASATADSELMLDIVGAFWWSWLLHGRWIEAENWLERALRESDAGMSSRSRAQALHAAATTATLRGRYAAAQAHLDAYVLLVHEVANDDLLLDGYGTQAFLRQMQGDTDGASALVEEMLRLARLLGRPWHEARAAEFVATRALKQGDLSKAATELARAVQLARASGDLWNVAMLLSHLGDVERMRGTHARATPLYEESIRLFEELGLRQDPSRVHNLGYVALAQGFHNEAEKRFLEALDAFRQVGDQRGIAECVIGLGCVRAAMRHPTQAARLFGAGEAALSALGTSVWPSNLADYRRWSRIVHAALGAEAWISEWNTGCLLGTDAVLGLEVEEPRGASSARSSAPVDALTRRERDVAELAAQGLSNRRIAEVLVIAEKTAANHLQNALDKLDLDSRSQLAARAVELGLVPARSS